MKFSLLFSFLSFGKRNETDKKTDFWTNFFGKNFFTEKNLVLFNGTGRF